MDLDRRCKVGKEWVADETVGCLSAWDTNRSTRDPLLAHAITFSNHFFNHRSGIPERQAGIHLTNNKSKVLKGTYSDAHALGP